MTTARAPWLVLDTSTPVAVVGVVELAIDNPDAAHGPRMLDITSPFVAGLGPALAAIRAGGSVDEIVTLVPDYCRPADAKLPSVDPSARRPAEA